MVWFHSPRSAYKYVLQSNITQDKARRTLRKKLRICWGEQLKVILKIIPHTTPTRTTHEAFWGSSTSNYWKNSPGIYLKGNLQKISQRKEGNYYVLRDLLSNDERTKMFYAQLVSEAKLDRTLRATTWRNNLGKQPPTFFTQSSDIVNIITRAPHLGTRVLSFPKKHNLQAILYCMISYR